MVEAGQLLGIDVLDHIVIGRQSYVSLRERGLGDLEGETPCSGPAPEDQG